MVVVHLEGYGHVAPEGRELVMLATAWVPLWAFLHSIGRDLIDAKLAVAAVYNEGARVEDELASALADRLQAALDSGAVAQAVTAMADAAGAPAPLDRLTVAQVRSFVTFVRASRGFAVW